MLAKEIRAHIIAPLLKSANLWSPSAEILVYGTGIIETGYNHLVQIGNVKNGGIGFWQCEPKTYLDVLKWIKRPENNRMLQNIMASLYYVILPADISVLMTHTGLAALICRAHYCRTPEPLPGEKDAVGLGEYYKKHYNSYFGKADVKVCQNIFQEIIDGKI